MALHKERRVLQYLAVCFLPSYLQCRVRDPPITNITVNAVRVHTTQAPSTTATTSCLRPQGGPVSTRFHVS